MKKNKNDYQNPFGCSDSNKTAEGKKTIRNKLTEWVKDNNWMCGYEGDDDGGDEND